jgi:DNA-binding NarL/FixJ family response regulator
MIKVVIADDHAIFREGLCSLLNKEADINVVGEAATGIEAVALCRELHPDVVVMDIVMPEMSGIEATRTILAEDRNVRVLALSMESDRRFIVEVLESGACGYVLKDAFYAELADAVRRVFKGETYLGPRISELIIRDYMERVPDGLPLNFTSLTDRERALVQLIASGRSTKEIAAEFGISIKTVEVHRQNVMKKLKLFSIAELTKYAVREGLSSLR